VSCTIKWIDRVTLRQQSKTLIHIPSGQGEAALSSRTLRGGVFAFQELIQLMKLKD